MELDLSDGGKHVTTRDGREVVIYWHDSETAHGAILESLGYRGHPCFWCAKIGSVNGYTHQQNSRDLITKPAPPVVRTPIVYLYGDDGVAVSTRKDFCILGIPQRPIASERVSFTIGKFVDE